MKKAVLLLLLAGCATKTPVLMTPPMPPGTVPRMFIAAPGPPAAPRMMQVTLAFEAQTANTNYAKTLELGLSANTDLSTTNWNIVWTGPYPESTNNFPATNYPGSWWTSNYWVTIQVTLSNQPPAAGNYRAFWRDKP